MPDASQTTLIYQRLRVAILELDLAPGLRLTERWLEAEFDASRTPVRAALVRLESEGLTQHSGRNWIVSPIDLDELEALAEFRETVEVAVVRLACKRADEEELLSLHTEQPAGEDGAVPDFHLRLAALSGNPFFINAMEGVMTRLSRTRWLEVRTPAASAHASSEHEAIISALVERDAETAASHVVTHIRNTRKRLTESLKDNRKGFTARGMSIVGTAATHQATGRGNAPAR